MGRGQQIQPTVFVITGQTGASISSTSRYSGQAHSVPEAVVLTANFPSQLHNLLFTVFGQLMSEECRLAFAQLPIIQMTWELQQEMMTNWVSMTCPKPKPEGLWKHEWRKHGSCSGMDRLTYFQAAIDLHAIYNLQKVFNHEGIYADGQMYDLQDLYQVLESYIGEEPIITCSFNEMHQVYQIYEVYICLDKYDLLPSPCPDAATFRTNCRTAYAMFPEFSPLQPPCQFNPPVSLYCTDPTSLAVDELNPSDEENLEFYLESVDSELASDDDEFQYFLGDTTDNALELDGELGFF